MLFFKGITGKAAPGLYLSYNSCIGMTLQGVDETWMQSDEDTRCGQVARANPTARASTPLQHYLRHILHHGSNEGYDFGLSAGTLDFLCDCTFHPFLTLSPLDAAAHNSVLQNHGSHQSIPPLKQLENHMCLQRRTNACKAIWNCLP